MLVVILVPSLSAAEDEYLRFQFINSSISEEELDSMINNKTYLESKRCYEKSQIKTSSPGEYKEPSPFSSASWELSLQPLFEQN